MPRQWNDRTFLIGPISAIAGLLIPALGSSPAPAQTFSGRTIEIFAPGGPGSGNDIYARTLAPYLAAQLPGNPKYQVKTIPGAGTIIGANQFQQQARPNGLSIISVSVSTVVNYTLRDNRVRFELPAWRPVLLSPQGAIIYGSPKLGIAAAGDIAKLKGQELVYGGASLTSSDLRVLVSLSLLGFKVRPVWGIDRGPARLGFERGEFNINLDSTPGFLRSSKQLIAEGKAVPLFTFGVEDANGKVVRDPVFESVPTFLEAYETVHGKPLSGTEYKVWHALFQQAVMTNKYLALPAGTPDAIVEAYRGATRRMLDDPAAKEKTANVFEGYTQVVGEPADAVIKNATIFQGDVMAWIENWLMANHNVSLK